MTKNLNQETAKVKFSVSKRSERFSPEPIFGTKEIEGNFEETIKYFLRLGHDITISNSSSNSNIVGLDVDFDLEIQDVTFEEED